MPRAAIYLTALLVLGHLSASAATPLHGEFDYNSQVDAAQDIQPPPTTARFPSVAVPIAPPGGSPAGTPNLNVTFSAKPMQLNLYTGGIGGTEVVSIGSVSIAFGSGTFATSGTTVYNFTINFVYQVTIYDHSFNETNPSPAPNAQSLPISGSFQGTVTRTATGRLNVSNMTVQINSDPFSIPIWNPIAKVTQTYKLTFSDPQTGYTIGSPSPAGFTAEGTPLAIRTVVSSNK